MDLPVISCLAKKGILAERLPVTDSDKCKAPRGVEREAQGWER